MPDHTSPNPSPAELPQATPVLAQPVDGGKRRPGGLTAVTVLCIVLGGMGIMSGIWGGIGLLLGGQMQKAFAVGPQGVGDEEGLRLQAEMQGAALDLQQRNWPLHTVSLSLQILICGGLLYGGIQAVRLQPSGRRFLFAACCAAALFEVLRAAPQVLLQLEMMAIYQQYLPRIMESSAGAEGQQAERMQSVFAAFTKGAMIFGMVLFFGWLLIKTIFYGLSARYLRQPHIRRLYEQADTSG